LVVCCEQRIFRGVIYGTVDVLIARMRRRGPRNAHINVGQMSESGLSNVPSLRQAVEIDRVFSRHAAETSRAPIEGRRRTLRVMTRQRPRRHASRCASLGRIAPAWLAVDGVVMFGVESLQGWALVSDCGFLDLRTPASTMVMLRPGWLDAAV